MQALVISAQDIRFITIGIWEDGLIKEKKIGGIQPEDELQKIVEFLKEYDVSINNLSAVIVVNGPGSFTSIRTSITIANSISFAKSIPILGLENKDRLSINELLSKISLSSLPRINEFVSAVYDRPAVAGKDV